jgi:drug/metabolite transporter superfamily protein YnfA
LIGYGVVPTFQPLEDFGRAYAAYGGVFIVGSYVFARIVDGFILDAGDYIGAMISLVGVVVAIAWPRSGGGLSS